MKKAFGLFKSPLTYAFLIPSLLMGLHYVSMDVWPFGESSVLVLDLNGQYVYYFEAFRDIILDGGSVAYTWLRAMGGEFMGIFAYYLASPFSALTALFPEGYMTEALLTIFILKTGSCGLTMAFYLKKTQKRDNIKIVIISTMYALSSYAIVQAHNTMWIDALIYLPLLTYAIEQLIKKRRFTMFVIILSLSLMANYYIGYMICIYTALYFFYYYIAHSKDHENNFYYEDFHFVKSLVRIGASSAIAVAMAAWVIYPAYYSLTFGKTTFSEPDFFPALKFDPMDLLSKLFFGSYDTVEPSGLPFIYCGTLALILLPLYFFSKKISARKRIMGGILIAVFVASFLISSLDLVWHGFQAPNWLNYRYSFMLIFIVLVFCYKVLADIEAQSFRRIVISAACVVLLLFIVQKLGYAHIGMSAIVGTLLAVAAILLSLHAVRGGYLGRGAVLILAVVVSVESFCSGVLHTMDLDEDVVISTRASYNDYINRVQPIVNEIYLKDNGFYRLEKTVHRKTNDNFTLGIRGLSNSTSTLNAEQIKLLNKLGLASKSHWSKYMGGTPVCDSLLGVKYLISEDAPYDGLYTSVIEDEYNELTAYENPYALPIAYGVNEEVLDIDPDDYDNPFRLMNELVSAMLGEDEVIEIFKEIRIEDMHRSNISTAQVENDHTKYAPAKEGIKATVTYTLTVPTDETVYMYIPTMYPREAALTVNGVGKGDYFGNDTHRIVDLGEYNENTVLDVSLDVGEEGKFYIKNGDVEYFYYFDRALFEEVMPRLRVSGANIESFDDTHLAGTVSIDPGDNILYTTIPYDEGWTVTVDGKEAELIRTTDALLSIRIDEGKHDIEFVYSPDAINHGMIISIAGTVIFIAIALLDVKMRRKRAKSYRNLVDITK